MKVLNVNFTESDIEELKQAINNDNSETVFQWEQEFKGETIILNITAGNE